MSRSYSVPTRLMHPQVSEVTTTNSLKMGCGVIVVYQRVQLAIFGIESKGQTLCILRDGRNDSHTFRIADLAPDHYSSGL